MKRPTETNVKMIFKAYFKLKATKKYTNMMEKHIQWK